MTQVYETWEVKVPIQTAFEFQRVLRDLELRSPFKPIPREFKTIIEEETE
jgi:hypothetical protein